MRGGKTLRAYDQFKRVVQRDGIHLVDSKVIGRFHRMSIGTITSDPAITVKFKTGKTLGTIEESFISRIRPKSNFFFAGKLLRLERVRDLTAIVTKAKTGKGAIPVWGGGKSPLSSELATAVREKFVQAREGLFDGAEMKAIRPTPLPCRKNPLFSQSLPSFSSNGRKPRGDQLVSLPVCRSIG